MGARREVEWGCCELREPFVLVVVMKPGGASRPEASE